MNYKLVVNASVCVGYICLIVGVVCGSVGEPAHQCGPFTWDLPIKMLILLAVPALFAFEAGRASVSASER